MHTIFIDYECFGTLSVSVVGDAINIHVYVSQ